MQTATNDTTLLGVAGNTLTFTGNATLRTVADGTYDLPQNIAINGGVTGTLQGAFGESIVVTGVASGSGTLVVQGLSAGFSVSLNHAANTFTGPIRVQSGDSATLTMRSLNDAGATSGTTIGLQSNGGHGGIFSYTGTAPLVLNNYRFELITNGDTGVNFDRVPTVRNNAASSANTMTINTDLLVTGTGLKHFVLRGSNTGDNTFAGIIPDASGASVLNLRKRDAGKWVLSGNNTYEGTTTIEAGTLSINSIKNVGGGASALGAPTTPANGTISIGSGTTTGGTLIYTGTGDTTDRVLNLAATTTGGATIDQSGTGLLKFTSNITNAGTSGIKTLTLQGSTAGTGEFAGNLVNGAGGTLAVTKAGTGTWRLSGDSSYTGVTNITGGTLEVTKLADGGSNSSIGAATNAASNLLIGNGLTLRYVGSGDSTNRNFTINGTVAGNNAILDASGTGAINFTNTATPAYGINNQGRFLQLTGTNTDANTLAANIANNGTGAVNVTKNGTGKWVLTGASTYTGVTTINDGTLLVNGSHTGGGAYTVNSPGTLGGTGSVTASVNVLAGGDLAPGNSSSIGTIGLGATTIAGAYDVELGTPGASHALPGLSDLTNVTGSLNYGGGTLNLIDNAGANGQGSAGAGSYQIFTYTGTNGPAFGSITGPGSLLAQVVDEGANGSGGPDGVFLDLFDPAAASFSSPGASTVLNLDIGTFTANSGLQSANFDIFNLLQTLGFTASLDLDMLSLITPDDLNLSTNLAPFSNLAPGSGLMFTAFLSTLNAGMFTETYELRLSSSGFADPAQILFLTISGTVAISTVAVPEPASMAIWAVVGLGLAVYGMRCRKVAR